MRPPAKTWPWLLLLPLFALVAVTQVGINDQNVKRDPKTGKVLYDTEHRPKYRYRSFHSVLPHTKQGGGILGPQLTPAVLLGMKSAIADMLWIKADGYFDSGQYEKIMPVCHVITWLDPQFLEVYIIGAWHMAYNFMDRRYIPAGVDFLGQGIENNKSDTKAVNELCFERGYMLMDKAQRFKEAADNSREANRLGMETVGKRHLLAHALEKDGQIDEAIKAWEAFEREERAKGNWQMGNVSRHNRDLTIKRQVWRSVLSKSPMIVKLDYKWSFPKPRKLRIEGTTNLPELTKVNVQLRDKGFEDLMRQHPGIGWQVTNLTLWWDNLTVNKDGKFSTWYRSGNLDVDRLDLTSEPAKYPLTSQEYEVVLTINPRVEPIQIQDKTGWNGEGIAGPKVKTLPNGVKIVQETFTITRDQLLGRQQVSQAAR